MIKQKITFATTNDMNSDSDISTKISKYSKKKNQTLNIFLSAKSRLEWQRILRSILKELIVIKYVEHEYILIVPSKIHRLDQITLFWLSHKSPTLK